MTTQELAAAMADTVKSYVKADRVALETRLAVAEAQLATLLARGVDESFTKELGTLRERVAVVEVTAPVPGPPGKDGADGLGFDDLAVEYDGERTIALTFTRGDQKKSFPVTVPVLIYRGVYQTGHAYEPGDTVTWAGHLWACKAATITQPGDAATNWQLCVQRGRDGKAAK